MLIIMEVEWFVCMWGFIVLIFLLSCVFESFNKMFKIKTEIIDCLEIIRNEMPAYLNLSAITKVLFSEKRVPFNVLRKLCLWAQSSSSLVTASNSGSVTKLNVMLIDLK